MTAATSASRSSELSGMRSASMIRFRSWTTNFSSSFSVCVLL